MNSTERLATQPIINRPVNVLGLTYRYQALAENLIKLEIRIVETVNHCARYL